MQLDPAEIEEVCKTLYIRALKLLPPDIKDGLRAAAARRRPTRPARRCSARWCRTSRSPSAPTTCSARTPASRSTTSRSAATSQFDGAALKQAIRRGCERATREHPLRSSVVHPITRKNEHTSCGTGVPVIHIDFDERAETLSRSR